ncbi:hypothetical protein CERZMDRAFT_98085 [Cercospora zeae-maydis SCOH1-5]|uniref:Transmembrane protein n=1 Tax=Cercospora zeae-maydis SCOH1-5 TaxID=717836 RepID=A0A6A6FDW8_9PEZI|nr:hypothetical protein CERZMDRAFT_98085 [Cercospora zeae-maydis SCOH1-5]
MAAFYIPDKFDWAEDVEESMPLGPPEVVKTNFSSTRRIHDGSESIQESEPPEVESMEMCSRRETRRYENEATGDSAMNGESEVPELERTELATSNENQSTTTVRQASLADHEEHWLFTPSSLLTSTVREHDRAAGVAEALIFATADHQSDEESAPSTEMELRREEQPDGFSLTDHRDYRAAGVEESETSASTDGQSEGELSRTPPTEQSLSANEETDDSDSAPIDSPNDENEYAAPSALAQICHAAWGAPIDIPDSMVRWSGDDDGVGGFNSALMRGLCNAAREVDGQGNVPAGNHSDAHAENEAKQLSASDARLRGNRGRQVETIRVVRGTEKNLRIRCVVWANVLTLVACFLCLCVQLRLYDTRIED